MSNPGEYQSLENVYFMKGVKKENERIVALLRARAAEYEAEGGWGDNAIIYEALAKELEGDTE